MVERSRDLHLDHPRRGGGGDPLAGLGRGEDGLNLEVLTWNLFHGRDRPPGGIEGGPGWRFLGNPVPRGDYLLLNRSLRDEFAGRLAEWQWDVALLQEVPVVWAGTLAMATGSIARISLTSRNWMSPVTAPLWSRRPHLIGSWEGGANLILVRSNHGVAACSAGSSTLRIRPERRRLHWIRLEDGPTVFNLHASTGRERASEDVLRAAAVARAEASEGEILFGGDLNVRPSAAPELFDRLASEFDLHLPEEADRGSIDQILSSGAAGTGGGRFGADSRDVVVTDAGHEGHKARLSDHDPVLARFDL